MAHQSELYCQAVELRRAVLRRPLGLDFSQEELDAESSQIHLVADLGGEVVGTLMLCPVSPRSMQIRQVAVAVCFQGKGIGRLLVLEAEIIAAKEGADHLFLHSRAEPIGFYQKLGYELDGPRFTEVGIEHQKMQKFLA